MATRNFGNVLSSIRGNENIGIGMPTSSGIKNNLVAGTKTFSKPKKQAFGELKNVMHNKNTTNDANKSSAKSNFKNNVKADCEPKKGRLNVENNSKKTIISDRKINSVVKPTPEIKATELQIYTEDADDLDLLDFHHHCDENEIDDEWEATSAACDRILEPLKNEDKVITDEELNELIERDYKKFEKDQPQFRFDDFEEERAKFLNQNSSGFDFDIDFPDMPSLADLTAEIRADIEKMPACNCDKCKLEPVTDMFDISLDFESLVSDKLAESEQIEKYEKPPVRVQPYLEDIDYFDNCKIDFESIEEEFKRMQFNSSLNSVKSQFDADECDFLF